MSVREKMLEILEGIDIRFKEPLHSYSYTKVGGEADYLVFPRNRFELAVPHQAEVIFRQRFEMTDKELEERIESYYDGENLFRSIKIRGEFLHMHVRMIPKSTPDTKFADVATHQPEYSRDNVVGTIVGFWTPEIFHGVSVAGYHLHFISDDLTFGGHVMDFVIKEGIIEVGAVDQLDQRFPVQDRQYLFAKFNVDEMKKDIEKAE
ncbi:alpha-acetolactate decarboxylase [Streptococcus pneumoniae]|nr:alpha-acetolactate decarboxylase [Streptococcus pneumoniae]